MRVLREWASHSLSAMAVKLRDMRVGGGVIVRERDREREAGRETEREGEKGRPSLSRERERERHTVHVYTVLVHAAVCTDDSLAYPTGTSLTDTRPV